MSSDGLTIMRLVLAAINGALFAFGLFLLVEYLYRQPKRLRNQLIELKLRLERTELAEREGVQRASDPSSSDLRERIVELEEANAKLKQSPKFLMNLSFGVLMILIAILSLLNLLFPSWLSFA
ncbi:hypothetical protein KQI52_01175 [bacterium]|nr:hypothetical protein [bacterium]